MLELWGRNFGLPIDLAHCL